MALVRCPTHHLTYNDENPRGCPACAAEKRGRKSQAAMMRDLARVSRRDQPQPELDEGPSILDRLRWRIPALNRRRYVQYGVGTIVVLALATLLLARPRFVAQNFPAVMEARSARPLPLRPRQRLSTLFAILGTRPPTPHPTDRQVERYPYGSRLYVDAVNGFIYSITIGVPSRTWQGLRVGASQRETEGNLALLGTPKLGGPPPPAPKLDRGYLVYSSLNNVPTRTLTAEVRPPNGCYDVVVEIGPQVVGLLSSAGTRKAVVATETGRVRWVARQIQVIDRSRNGPLGRRAC